MEEKDFPENSNSEIIDTGPPVSNTDDPPAESSVDPPNDSTLAKGSPPIKFLSSMKRRIAAAIAAVVCLAFVIGGFLSYASKGAGGSVPSVNFKDGGKCDGEVVYYPIMTVSPMKLLKYYSRYGENGNGQKGSNILTNGSAADGAPLKLSDGKPVDLKKNAEYQDLYYGNTILGFNDGMLLMPSSGCYEKCANSEFPTWLDNKDINCLVTKGNGNFSGGNTPSSHIVFFRDKSDAGNINKSVKHVFTDTLKAESDDKYKMSQLVEKLKDGKWEDVIKKKSNYRKESFELWEAISYVSYSGGSYKLEPTEKIVKFLSPSSDKLLENNLSSDSGTPFADMEANEQQKVLYHELDLLMTLYVVASENNYTVKSGRDSKLPDAWADVIEQFLDGWDNPTEGGKLDTTKVYDTLVLTNCFAYVDEPGGRTKGIYIAPTGDYIEQALNLSSTATITKPKSANSYDVDLNKQSGDCGQSNNGVYMYNLCRAAVKASGIKNCPAKSNANGIVRRSYLENVIGHQVEFDSDSSGKMKLTYGQSDHDFKYMGAVLQLKPKVWGSNLIFISPWNESDGVVKALPQFSVNLTKMDYASRKIKEKNIPGQMNKTTTINEYMQLNFHVNASIGENKDQYFKDLEALEDRDSRKRAVRPAKENQTLVKKFLKDKSVKDMSVSYHLKRFVCVDDIKEVVVSDGSKIGGSRATSFKMSKEDKEGFIKARKAAKGDEKKTELKDGQATLKKISSSGDNPIFSAGIVKVGNKDVDKQHAYQSCQDGRVQDEVSAVMNGNEYHVSDVWVNYRLPDITDSNSEGSTYRYGFIASALAGSQWYHLCQSLEDATLTEYGVYLEDTKTKSIEVIYKVEEAYLNFTGESYSNMDSDEKKYQPYEKQKTYLGGNSLQMHTAIKAVGTGEPVRKVYHFFDFPYVSLKPEIRASVGGALKLTESGGTVNPEDTGIEDTDAKFDTEEGYVKKTSDTIGDIPSITIGLDPGDSLEGWKKILNSKSDKYQEIVLCITVKRELSSEGTLPDNVDDVPWEFNFKSNVFKTTAKSTGSKPVVWAISDEFGKTATTIMNANGVPAMQSMYLPKDGELRGQSISELMETEKPGKTQFAQFSMCLDNKTNKDLFLRVLEGGQMSIGDTEILNPDTKNTSDLQITNLSKTNSDGLRIEKCPGKQDRGHEMFTILDYSMAKLNAKGITDVRATYTVSVNLYVAYKDSLIEIMLTPSLQEEMIGSAFFPENTNSAPPVSTDASTIKASRKVKIARKVMASETSTEEDIDLGVGNGGSGGGGGYSDSVVYYPSDMQRDLVLDTAVNPNDSSTFATDTNTSKPVTSTADSSDYKSEHKDTGKNKIYSRKAYVKCDEGETTTIQDSPTIWIAARDIGEMLSKIGSLDNKSFTLQLKRDGIVVDTTELQSASDFDKIGTLLQKANTKKGKRQNIYAKTDRTPNSTVDGVYESSSAQSDFIVLRDNKIQSEVISYGEEKTYKYSATLKVYDTSSGAPSTTVVSGGTTTKLPSFSSNTSKVVYSAKPADADFKTDLLATVNVPGYEGTDYAEISNTLETISDSPSVDLNIYGADWVSEWESVIGGNRLTSATIKFKRTPNVTSKPGSMNLSSADGRLSGLSGSQVTLTAGKLSSVKEALKNLETQFKNLDNGVAGFEVTYVSDADGNEIFDATFEYQATVSITYKTSGGTPKTVTHDTNVSKIRYHAARYTVINANMAFSTNVRNYAELKEGYVQLGNQLKAVEQYEAMAGVPSTQKLFFSAGGNQYLLDIDFQTVSNAKTSRYYRSIFNSTDCEFKAHDQLRAMACTNLRGGGVNVNNGLAHYTKLDASLDDGHFTQTDSEAKLNGYVQYANIPIMKLPTNLTGEFKNDIKFTLGGHSSSESYEDPYRATDSEADRSTEENPDVQLTSDEDYSKLVNNITEGVGEDGETYDYTVHTGSYTYSDPAENEYMGAVVQDHNTPTNLGLTITGKIKNESTLNPGDNGKNYTSALGVTLAEGSPTTIDSTNEKDKMYGIGGETYKENVTVGYTTQVAKRTISNNTSVTDGAAADAAVTFSLKSAAEYDDEGNETKAAVYECSKCKSTASEAKTHYYCAKDGKCYSSQGEWMDPLYKAGATEGDCPKDTAKHRSGTGNAKTYYHMWGGSNKHKWVDGTSESQNKRMNENEIKKSIFLFICNYSGPHLEYIDFCTKRRK